MKILGYDYKLMYTAKKDRMGDVRVSKLRIRIGDNLADQQKVSTVLHEMIHAVSDHLCLDLKEKQVGRLESGLYQALTDNGVDLSPLISELREVNQDKEANP